MIIRTISFFLISATSILSSCSNSEGSIKQNLNGASNFKGNEICTRFSLPDGYTRIQSKKTSFEYYLQHLPLKPEGSKVFYYNGLPKFRQDFHVAVVDLDIGEKDLQQCADAVMRLWGEYLYQQGRFNEISFNFVSDGKPRYFLSHSDGDTSYFAFRKYMDYVFSYANTRSLFDQLEKVEHIQDIKIGDVFIQKKNPYGHAVIVVDMAENESDGSKMFLLAQSYMPAQSIHILKNPEDKNLSPWYLLGNGNQVITTEWIFSISDLRRFSK